jgi:hypothetical protein
MVDAFRMVVEIDLNEFNEVLPELFELWGIKEENHDEGLIELLKVLACRVFQIITQDHIDLLGVLKAFKSGEDGWPQMDGQWGIKIVEVEYFDFSPGDFSVEKA